MKKIFSVAAFVFFFFVFSLLLVAHAIHADNSLLAYWKLDETTAGSTAVDSSGNGYNGIPHNSPSPSTDVPSTISFTDPRSLSFDGSQWVSISDNSAFAMNSATFSVWVKFSSLSDDMDMIAKRSQDGSQIQWQFGYSGGGNDFKVSLANDGGHSCCTDFNWSPSPGLTTNTWYNIAVTIDGTAHTITWYQNGVSKHNESIGSNSLGTQVSSTDLTLGASYNGNGEFLNGLLDDVRIYNTALNDSDIADIASGDSGPGVPTPTPLPTSTPTPTNTLTPTPTSAPNASPPNQSPQNNSSSAPSCTSSPPTGKADLFQIDAKQTQATLFFAPASGNVTNYAISYGYTSGDGRFNTFTNQGNSTGVLLYMINYLSPHLTYYMKVRPYNGCMPGNWSNEMKISMSGNNSTIRYYNTFISQILSIFPQQATVLGAATTRRQNTTPACQNYRVMPGDSLWQIAQNRLGNGTRYQQIETSNNLYTTVLSVGQTLKIGCK